MARASGTQPPIVDVAGLVEGGPGALERVAEALIDPCRSWGAFHLVGHGIPERELAEFDAAMRAFFELPDTERATVRRTRANARGYYDEELTKNRPDWKEVFDYGAEPAAEDAATAHSDGRNQWPAGRHELRRVLLEHQSRCERIGLALLRALCVSLGLPARTLDSHFRPHSSFVRLNRYGRCPDPASPDAPLLPERGRLGVHHHTDAGALTLLYQDDVPGLQVRRDDRFVLVEPLRGAFAVNLGDMLQVWSNDRYHSPTHRVLVSAERERHSAPFFLNPGYQSVCEPLPGLLASGEAPRFRPISWAHFRDQRSAGDYADYGAEIQIDDYRIGAAAR
jgi:isopenicillin N synthase-like dioxygenase